MVFYLSLGLKFDLPEDLQSNVTITAYIGSSKKECDVQVENNSILGDCIPVLGHFVKFVACKTENPCSSMSAENQCKQDAFQLLMASSKDETKLPKAYENPKRNDLKLYNDILGWLKSLKIGWSNGLDANSISKSFVIALRDTLWYIDGHWKTLSGRGYHIPDTLKKMFPEGYNVSHSWKGRKRVAGNRDINNLESLLNTLFEQTCTSFMHKINWKHVRVIILQLADALRKYMEDEGH